MFLATFSSLISYRFICSLVGWLMRKSKLLLAQNKVKEYTTKYTNLNNEYQASLTKYNILHGDFEKYKTLNASNGDWETKYNERNIAFETTKRKLETALAQTSQEVEVIKEVPVEVIKEIEVIKEVTVEVVKEVEKEVPVEVIKEIEVIKEVPVEIIKEVEVVRYPDMAELLTMMKNMSTSEVSRTVVGEQRIEGEITTTIVKATRDNLKK